MSQIAFEGQTYQAPDFIVGGAMKCATTTLHHLLNQHPEVFIPPGELKFFSLDDFVQQPEFFFPQSDGKWQGFNFDKNMQQYLEWYSNFFEPAPKSAKLLGEDTPTYLASNLAPKRIRELLPQVKLIFLLRNPVDRVYSHYWHWVRNGRAFYTFEESLRFQTVPLLQRSFYFEQLSQYFALFPREQIKVILFEELLGDPNQIANETFQFLGLPAFELADPAQRENQGATPRFQKLKVTCNHLLRATVGRKALRVLPGEPTVPTPSLAKQWLARLHRRINPDRQTKPPPMNTETRAFLTEQLVQRNQGLSKLLSRSLTEHWGPEYQEV